MKFRSAYALAILSLMSAIVPGCGGGDHIKPMSNLTACRGTVTLDGTPLEHGSIRFVPVVEKSGQPAISQIKNGSFTMITTVSSPGVVIGKYKVMVESSEELPDAGPPQPGKLPAPPKSLIPEKYNKIATSGLEVEVTEGMDAVDFELTSK